MPTISVRLSVILATLTLSLASNASGQSCTYGPFTSGHAATELTWCVSEAGTLEYLETPDTYEHLTFGTLLEGYAVCSALGDGPLEVNGWESGGLGASAWGAAVASDLSAGGVTITRTTADGRLRLTMKFSRDTVNRAVIVAMTVRNNMTAGKVFNVQVARFADIDAAGEAGNNTFVSTVETVTAVNTVKGRGLEMNAKNVNGVYNIGIADPFHPATYSSCLGQKVFANPASGDYGAQIVHFLSVLKAGQAKTVTFRYRAP